MTTINDISDLVKILQEQPQWTETLRSFLLSRELLELPETFAAFVETADQQFEAVNRRFEAVDQRLDSMETKMDQGFEAVNQRFEAMDVKMDQGFAEVNRRFNQMNGRLDNALGVNYEYKIEKNIYSIAEDQLDMERIRLWKGPYFGPAADFMDMIEEARVSGAITRDEHREMCRADIILRCMGPDRQPAEYAAIEISITIGDSDIVRVSRRAEILALALDHPVIPAVIGTQIDDERSQLARANNVRVAIMPN
jgi:tetrahydromethanopterin S-methyltransferase subunit G